MNDAVLAVLMAVLIIVCFTAYMFSMGRVFPKYIISRRYNIRGNLGRGLKKFTSSDGRAVVYEPHPSIRKYINKYALVAKSGHKYLECSIDSAVRSLTYTLVMLNNKNKVIDVLEVDDQVARLSVTHPVYLHADTSYVALILSHVNGEKLEGVDEYGYYKARDIGLYALMSAGASFIAYLIFSLASDAFIAAVSAESVKYSFNFFSALAASLLVGIISALMLMLFSNRRNVRVVFND